MQIREVDNYIERLEEYNAVAEFILEECEINYS